jgi:kanamycin kinase
MSAADRCDRIARRPVDGAFLPDVVRELAKAEQITPVWENQLGGLTFEIGEGESRRFAKWAKAGSGLDLDTERQRLQWANPYIDAPRVLDHGRDSEQSWLVTAGITGDSAVSEYWRTQPAVAAHAIGAQLRLVHDALPADTCPFEWSVETRLSSSSLGPSDGFLDVLAWRSDFEGVAIKDGQPAGVVDLGAMGVADRWADLAVATWSTEWNYGPGWQQTLLDAYGIEADAERIDSYRLLWELGEQPSAAAIVCEQGLQPG